MTKPSIGNDKDRQAMWDAIKAATYQKNGVEPVSTEQTLVQKQGQSYLSGAGATNKKRIELLNKIKADTYKKFGIIDEKHNPAATTMDELFEEKE